MKICSKCGEKFESGKFCKYCGGTLVDEAEVTQELHCSKCGAVLAEGSKFCPNCGTKVSVDVIGEKVSVRDFSKIDIEHLEQYDLTTLVWARLECPTEYNKTFDDFIIQKYGLEEIIAVAEKNNENFLQFYIGLCYQYGYGCEIDNLKAYLWYKKSATQDYIYALYKLGTCNFFGIGCDVDEDSAFRCYKKAASQGYERAYMDLGRCYMIGIGTETDYDEAFKFKKGN